MNPRSDVHAGFSGDESSSDRHRAGGRPRHLLVAPLVWALHFGFVYGASAVGCADRGPGPETMRMLVFVATAIALALLAWACASSWRLRRSLGAEAPSPARRQRRFLAATTLSTCTLAAVAVVFDTLPSLLSTSCA